MRATWREIAEEPFFKKESPRYFKIFVPLDFKLILLLLFVIFKSQLEGYDNTSTLISKVMQPTVFTDLYFRLFQRPIWCTYIDFSRHYFFEAQKSRKPELKNKSCYRSSPAGRPAEVDRGTYSYNLDPGFFTACRKREPWERFSLIQLFLRRSIIATLKVLLTCLTWTKTCGMIIQMKHFGGTFTE